MQIPSAGLHDQEAVIGVFGDICGMEIGIGRPPIARAELDSGALAPRLLRLPKILLSTAARAHVVAALNHLHICQIYDVGPIEFVEGTPLKVSCH